MIPLENTSRCPRLVSQRGRNASSATKLARNGNPLKLVFPPVYRISAVAAWTRMNMMWPNSEVPKTILASCAITVGTPSTYGAACVACASQEIPATSEPRMSPSVTSTLRALMPSGGRNTLTALDTASMPVSDEPPFANARSSTNTSPNEISEL